MVVRTEPHEPRLIGRGVGYWRVGRPSLQTGESVAKRSTRGTHILEIRYRSLRCRRVAQRCQHRWWNAAFQRSDWSVHHAQPPKQRHSNRIGYFVGVSFFAGFYALVLGLGIHAIVSQLSYVKGGLLIGLFVVSVPAIAPPLVIEGFRALKVKSLRLDSNSLHWDEEDGRSHALKLETVRRIRRSASKWTVESSDGLSVVLPITPVLDLALSHARYALMPNVVDAENKAHRRGRIRCLIYLALSPFVATAILMTLAPGLPIRPTLAPLIGFVAQIAFLLVVVAAIVAWRRYRIGYDRRRDHAANRQNSTTPLPSPTTPKDPQT